MKTCRVIFNSIPYDVKVGNTILDAALRNNIVIPHECRAGICGTCKINVLNGLSVHGETSVLGQVKSCQARILSDMEVEIEETPEVRRISGRVIEINKLASDIVEVNIKTNTNLNFYPGQYCVFTFRWFPERSYSLTMPMVGPYDPSIITLHVRQYKDGLVSSEIGTSIKPNHPVKIEGPFGTAFFRKKHRGRIILASSATGFAPNWAIVNVALVEDPYREIYIIAGIRTTDMTVYMHSALQRLVRFPNVVLLCSVGKRPLNSALFREGYPADHIPPLRDSDAVYVCGSAHLINSFLPLMKNTKAKFYFDCFG